MAVPIPQSGSARGALHIGLWFAQSLLALAFGAAGAAKLLSPMEVLSVNMPWTADVPEPVVRLIAICELFGVAGLILPAVLRVFPQLIAPAAGGLTAIMFFASVFHFWRGELEAIPVTFFLGTLAALVAWGRAKVVPITERTD